MAYTSHGYHIPGTSRANPPIVVYVWGCNGPADCEACSGEATEEFERLKARQKTSDQSKE